LSFRSGNIFHKRYFNKDCFNPSVIPVKEENINKNIENIAAEKLSDIIFFMIWMNESGASYKTPTI